MTKQFSPAAKSVLYLNSKPFSGEWQLRVERSTFGSTDVYLDIQTSPPTEMDAKIRRALGLDE